MIAIVRRAVNTRIRSGKYITSRIYRKNINVKAGKTIVDLHPPITNILSAVDASAFGSNENLAA